MRLGRHLTTANIKGLPDGSEFRQWHANGGRGDMKRKSVFIKKKHLGNMLQDSLRCHCTSMSEVFLVLGWPFASLCLVHVSVPRT